MFSTRHAFLVGQHRLQCNYTARQHLGVKQTSSQRVTALCCLKKLRVIPFPENLTPDSLKAGWLSKSHFILVLKLAKSEAGVVEWIAIDDAF